MQAKTTRGASYRSTTRAYHFLFAGLDYNLNPSLDLYFNVMYAEMDYAFRAGAEALVFGQTADDFKVRLGCSQTRDSSTSLRRAASGP